MTSAASRKAAERQARRDYILAAARRLFATKGADNTSMEDIAREADYTRRTLYSYFESRDEVCVMVLTDDLKVRWETQQKAIAHASTGLDKIINWGTSFYDFARANSHSMRLQYYMDFKGIDPRRISKGIFKAFEKINNELAEGLREIFHLGIRDGSLRPDLNIDMSISQYLYTLRSILNRALSPSYSFASFDPDEYVKHYLDLFIRGIRNTKGITR
ncbi:MAG: TetR/AcrR family transcriptional regulator [Candidatus Zixiibacteriota bacterium]|nr:MAG: TetR/AcrR family transcriptional regulator [candidate division Zixibacteria bacterium]